MWPAMVRMAYGLTTSVFFRAAYPGPLAQGDVVYLQSYESSLPYIAVVERCVGPQLLCRWFYRYSELPARLRAATKPGQHELYLSTHKDENTRESVLGLCRVVAELGEGEQEGVHLCRYAFDTQKQALVLMQTVEWTVQGASKTSLPPGMASCITNVNTKKRRCKFPLVPFATVAGRRQCLTDVLICQARPQKLQKNGTIKAITIDDCTWQHRLL